MAWRSQEWTISAIAVILSFVLAVSINVSASDGQSEGFKPSSFDVIKGFSSNHRLNPSASEVNATFASNPHLAKHPLPPNAYPREFKLDILRKDAPTVISLFNKTDSDSNSSSSQTESTNTQNTPSTEHFPSKSPRLYYSDVARNNGQGAGYPSASLNEISVSDPRPPPLHDEAGYKFHFPDKYLAGSKNVHETIGGPIVGDLSHSGNGIPHHSPHLTHNYHPHGLDHTHVRSHGHEHPHHVVHHHHGHSHESHGHQGHEGHGPVHEHRGVVSGHGPDLGYSSGPAHTPYSYPPPHYGGHGFGTGSHGDVQGFIGGPALGKALSVLIPSAIFLTGVSALFPKRVKVPTQNINIQHPHQRQKRSTIEHQLRQVEDFEIIPSQTLRREHRIDDGQESLYDYDFGRSHNPYVTFGQIPQHVFPVLENYPQPHYQNHHINHAPPLVVQQVPSFVPIPQEELPHMDPMEMGTPQPEMREPESEEREPQPEIRASQPEVREPEPEMRAPQLESEYQTESAEEEVPEYKYETFHHYLDLRNPRIIVNGPPEMMTQIQQKIPSPKPEFVQPTVEPVKSQQSAPVNSARRTKIRAKSPNLNKVQKTDLFRKTPVSTTTTNSPSLEPTPLVQAAASNSHNVIDEQNILKRNQKDSTAGKGTAKVLKELLMATKKTTPKEYDLSPNGPVLGLLAATIEHGGQSDPCQRRSLCELAIRGSSPQATKFETFLWSLATLVPDAFTTLYDVDDVFLAIRTKNCKVFVCSNPNLNIQE